MKIRNLVLILLFISISLLTLNCSKTTGNIWDKEIEKYSGSLNITVYRSPTCECCEGWIAHLKKHHFQVTDMKMDDMDSVKQKYNVPENMVSCHTAIIDGFVIEGHVPADDIISILKKKPDIAGLSVPGMSTGSPGMEQDNKKEPFQVMSFDNKGNNKTFREYQNY